jgi:hypothetical protein
VENWAAVADAINERVSELGWPQGELAERSQVSRATVREVQHHTVQRRRSTRTLEALSTALGWHPQHIESVLRGHRPADSPAATNSETLHSRIDALEKRLTEITEHLTDIKTTLATVLNYVRKDV